MLKSVKVVVLFLTKTADLLRCSIRHRSSRQPKATSLSTLHVFALSTRQGLYPVYFLNFFLIWLLRHIIKPNSPSFPPWWRINVLLWGNVIVGHPQEAGETNMMSGMYDIIEMKPDLSGYELPHFQLHHWSAREILGENPCYDWRRTLSTTVSANPYL